MVRGNVQSKANVSEKTDNRKIRTISMMKLSLNPDVL